MTEPRTERALIIDDDPVVRVMARQAFENEGFAVSEAESG